jgi:glycosyltransferase involved in cell wall biosynthesis
MTLFYCPLEDYPERYTGQLASWFQDELQRQHVAFAVVPGDPRTQQHIQTGQVLDACRRGQHAMAQSSTLLSWIAGGSIADGDVIYFDDFWHPGVEAVKYALHQHKLDVKLFAFCWAQSVDKFDFTHGMLPWIRPFEQGNGHCYDRVFFASSMLAAFAEVEGISRQSAVVGLPFNSHEVLSRMPLWYHEYLAGERRAMVVRHRHERKRDVVFSSRFDWEKNPQFFIEVMQQLLERHWATNIRFVICTSQPALRSNDPSVLVTLKQLMARFPHSIKVASGLTKEQYYETLCKSRVQFNCAYQDWVSFTLLEALTAGCYPIYPDWRSFPETFGPGSPHLYADRNVDAAVDAILHVMDADEMVWDREAILDRQSTLLHRHDKTITRILAWMEQIPDMDGSLRRNAYRS